MLHSQHHDALPTLQGRIIGLPVAVWKSNSPARRGGRGKSALNALSRDSRSLR